ncbi:MAG: PQQ-dependent dehydrogenase, methanol/ethanol family [Sphingobium phenoxybenzoativorans]
MSAMHGVKPSERLLDNSGGADWSGYGRTYGEQHYSPLDQVNAGNVERLGLAWSLDLPAGNTVTQPIAVDGVIYFAMGYSFVHAVDALTGKLLWSYDPEVYKTAGPKQHAGWGSRGIAWWNGKVYTVTHDGFVIALDAKTGKPLWKVPTLDKDDSSYVTGAPRIFDGKLIIGNSGDYGAVRGHATAIDAETGKRLWRFWVVPGDPAKGFENEAMAMAAKTWSGEWWKFGGGGTPWNAFTYDPETDTVFIGTGNGYPYNHRVRSQGKGDNLFLASVVAVDAKTGKYKWHYQANPGETWDFTFTQDMPLADLNIDGKPRKVLMAAPKNGFYYIIDRITGKLISAEPFVDVNWASKIDLGTGRPVENPEARYANPAVVRPTSLGGHNWQPMSYNPKTGLVYLPANELSARLSDDGSGAGWLPPTDVTVGGGPGFVADFKVKDGGPRNYTSSLIAWDPVQQKLMWRVQAPRMVPAGVVSTGGGLVFQGGIDSRFSAYSAVDGKRLWSFDTQAPSVAPPITFSVKGRQYVTVLTGFGTSSSSGGAMLQRYRLDYRTMARRVLTFALDGKAVLPPKVEPDWSKPADPDYRPNPALASQGAAIYAQHCTLCHGFGAVAAGMAPDLRRSFIPLSEETFLAVVRDGILQPNNMPKFDNISAKDLAAVRQYIRAQAHNPESDKETEDFGQAM